jgi:hypothetical protein
MSAGRAVAVELFDAVCEMDIPAPKARFRKDQRNLGRE